MPPEAHALFRILMPMLTLVGTVLLEKTTRKTSRNSRIRPSQMEEDHNTAQRAAQAND